LRCSSSRAARSMRSTMVMRIVRHWLRQFGGSGACYWTVSWRHQPGLKALNRSRYPRVDASRRCSTPVESQRSDPTPVEDLRPCWSPTRTRRTTTLPAGRSRPVRHLLDLGGQRPVDAAGNAPVESVGGPGRPACARVPRHVAARSPRGHHPRVRCRVSDLPEVGARRSPSSWRRSAPGDPSAT
jgi:hypothetical protein